MKIEASALWVSVLIGLAAARPASKACGSKPKSTSIPKTTAPQTSCKSSKTSTYQSSSVTFATYSGLPSGSPVGQESIATLLPGVFWDKDLDDVNNLVPGSSCKLFYAEHDDAKRPGQIAQADYKMKFPTVALEHSRHVKSVGCSKPDHMDISFRSRKSYEWAKKHWIPFNAATNDTMVFVGKFNGCNPTKDDGMRSWSLVDDVTFNDDTFDVDATIQYRDIKEVVDTATIKFGKYVPKSRPQSEDSAAPAAPTPAGYQAPYYASIATSTASATPVAHHGQYAADYGKWGTDFDVKKDNKIGYVDASRPSTTPAPRPMVVDKRWSWNPWKDITSAFQAVTSEVKDIASGVSSVFVEATSAIESGAQAIATEAAEIFNDWTSYTKDLDLPTFNINVDVNDGATPWNLPGRKLLDDVAGVTLYCVNCGVSGSAHFSASVTFSLLHGIEAGSIDFEGNLKAAFSVGIVNNNTNLAIPWPGSTKYEIFNVGLPNLYIPNVVTIGPYIALDVVGSISIGATGLIRAGFEFELEKPSFHADLKDISKSTASGWEPKFKPIFDINGNLTLNAQLQTPISLNFGINILKGTFELALSLSEAPTVKLSLINGFEGGVNPNALDDPTTGLINGTFTPNTGTCPGSVLGLRVGLDTIIGIKGTPLTYPLLKIDLYKNEWCIEHNLWSIFDTPTRRTIDAPNPGYSTGRIDSIANDLSLVSGDNGNIYVDSSTVPEGSNGNDTSYQWLHWNNLVVGTKDGRLLYTYPDELSTYGVSRFRVAPWERLPKTAEQVVVVPNNNAMTAYTVGKQGKTLYPVACTYKKQPTKVFLVTDPVEGAKKLERPEYQDCLTGGEVHACGFIRWKSTNLQEFAI
ncbi:hypothetical protein H072_10020 [Dactylellina haptotyla CBS 200.50]|uniref:Uncharacterized protein n=1 Tax=Dactylellina haptotyla (strain CBS 200.50) TaxID=1284197 RepID=S8A0H0_DACHA|nr:hypothetical protein H072_10020 [Dactylellina haptotyla CBS 200.50]